MLDFPRWKTYGISGILLLGIIFALPSLLPEKMTQHLPALLQSRVNLGLDLAGGSHLLLEADTADLAVTQLATMEKIVRQAMRGETGPSDDIAIGEMNRQDGRVSFLVRDSAQLDEARERLLGEIRGVGLTGQRDWNISIIDSARIILTPTAAGRAQAIDHAMETARAIVGRRVNALGTREPTIRLKSRERIVVQVPGLENPGALKDLLGQTARLEFRMVDENASLDAATTGRAPVGSEIIPYASVDAPAAYEVLRRQVMINGEQLTSARQGFDPQNGQPVVNISFDPNGSRTFARVTSDNVGKRFAMVLDGKILSAPSINEPILGGSAQISGQFSKVDSANALAIALRSGALPVKLAIIEERTVTPELGADSIRKGAIAAIIATVAVLTFMVIVYGRFGVYANIALIFNVWLIIAIMAASNATLTLPGIAGFVLTIGAAVDANVLINERIREELKRGRRVPDAISTGYKEASRAIFDANITNVIAAALMFWLGSGPVKGFAVVLTVGIVTSVFTAVTVTRLFVAHWLRAARPKAITI